MNLLESPNQWLIVARWEYNLNKDSNRYSLDWRGKETGDIITFSGLQVTRPQPDFSEAHQNLELRSEDQVLPREVLGQCQESGTPLPVPPGVTSHEGTKVRSQENQEACVMRGLQAGPGEAFWRNFLSRSPEFAVGFYVCLWCGILWIVKGAV